MRAGVFAGLLVDPQRLDHVNARRAGGRHQRRQ